MQTEGRGPNRVVVSALAQSRVLCLGVVYSASELIQRSPAGVGAWLRAGEWVATGSIDARAAGDQTVSTAWLTWQTGTRRAGKIVWLPGPAW